jgi:hypothetical protein
MLGQEAMKTTCYRLGVTTEIDFQIRPGPAVFAEVQ